MTCWRPLKEWHEVGVWKRFHQVLLDRLGRVDRIDWSRMPSGLARSSAVVGGVDGALGNVAENF